MGKKKKAKLKELIRIEEEKAAKKKSTGIVGAIVWSAIAIYFFFIT